MKKALKISYFETFHLLYNNTTFITRGPGASSLTWETVPIFIQCTITSIKRKKRHYLLFENWNGPYLFLKVEFHSPKGVLCQLRLKLAHWVLKKKIFKISSLCTYFCYFVINPPPLPGPSLNFEFTSPYDAFFQVRLKLKNAWKIL